MSQVEFSRTVRIDTIGTVPRALQVEADEAERAALARRFDLPSLDRLQADVDVSRGAGEIIASGRIQAEVTQRCVVTAEPVSARIDEPFAVRFRPPPAAGSPEEEIELAEEELDVMFTDGALIDVGEAVAQTLALNLDSYPRAPGAETALQEAGVKDEGEAGPFGALAALKEKLGK